MDYQLVLYDTNNVIIDVTTPISQVTVDGNNVYWSNGRAEGVNTNFVVVPADEVVGQPGDLISQDVIAKDKKGTLLTKEAQLVEQIKALQEALNFLLGI